MHRHLTAEEIPEWELKSPHKDASREARCVHAGLNGPTHREA
jgi:hypothetical protein